MGKKLVGYYRFEDEVYNGEDYVLITDYEPIYEDEYEEYKNDEDFIPVEKFEKK